QGSPLAAQRRLAYLIKSFPLCQQLFSFFLIFFLASTKTDLHLDCSHSQLIYNSKTFRKCQHLIPIFLYYIICAVISAEPGPVRRAHI
ncbi:MAG: hypothetical protein K1W25_10365, partial [Lachnospiraceae bacterium]